VHGASQKYHHDILGCNDRLDAIQAAFLRVKLKYYDEWNGKRRRIAAVYDDALRDFVKVPVIREDCETVYHQYTIRTPRRDELRQFVQDRGIGTSVHYPVPIHLQRAFEYLGHRQGDFPEAEKAAKEVLSLPIHPHLSDEEVEYVVGTVREFFTGG
jgi:dTDP-4-amino-4,6-dideoxygalactose transaminase